MLSHERKMKVMGCNDELVDADESAKQHATMDGLAFHFTLDQVTQHALKAEAIVVYEPDWWCWCHPNQNDKDARM